MSYVERKLLRNPGSQLQDDVSSMRFVPNATRAHLETAFPKFIGLVGVTAWRRRLDELSKWRIQNPLYQDFLIERHGPELAFEELTTLKKQRGRIPFPPDPPIHHLRLFNLAVTVVALYEHLSGPARAKLVGYLRTCLTQEYGLGPVIFEMQVIAHLMRVGFDVVPNDLESSGGFDFLATKGASELEVECKHISADIGRQIHKRKLLDLGVRLLPEIQSKHSSNGEALLVEAVLPGRLVNSVGAQSEIIDAIVATIVKNEAVSHSACKVSLRRMPIPLEHPALIRPEQQTVADLKAIYAPLADLEGQNVMFSIRPGRSICAVRLRSAKPDAVLTKIIENLKYDARRQFTQTRPALLCAHFADLTADNLIEIAALTQGKNPVQNGISHLIDRRPFLHSVALTATGAIRAERNAAGKLVAIGLQDGSYTFYNHLHPKANDPNLKGIFAGDHTDGAH